MELCLSPKSHTLTLVSGTLPQTGPSIRREFLGCSHNLRLPGAPIPRRKCRRIRIRQNNSPSLLIDASFGSSSVVVVVAVSALSAVSIAYLNHHLSHKSSNDKSSKETLGSLSRRLSRLGRNIVNHIIGSSFLDVGEVHRGTNLSIQGQELAEKGRENGHVIEGKESHVQILENTSMNESSHLVEIAESDNADYAVSNARNHMVSIESEASNLSPLLLASPEPEIVPPLVLARGISELTLENGRKETKVDSEFHQLMAKESNIASPLVNIEVDEKSDISSYNGTIVEYDRKDIYTFYEENQSTVESPSKLNGLKAASPHPSSLIGNSFPSLNVNGAVKDAELLANQPPYIAESVERKVYLRYERGSSHKNENIRRRGFPREKEKGHLIQDDHTKLTEFPYPNGVHSTNKDNPSEQVHAYNHLLRNGRLAECVDLLEDMERRGLLDMSKIYHTKFFKICKHQKAIKEAFRFCKLVPNPTLSTFNMLMTVCANSQDSEGAFQVLRLAQGAGFKADCKLYTTLISTCAKSGKVDAMFEVW